MSTPPGAVFLSYAREDGDAARRIADALGAFGIEVWLDRDELRGGDAWDAKIRQQIKQCTLFLPILSARTQARREGYFRREWNLAVERTQHLAPGARFLLPVAIDDVPDSGAAVPDAFRQVQWMRLPNGVATTAFIEEVQRALADATGQSPSAPPPAAPRPAGLAPPAQKPRRSVPALLVARLAVALLAVLCLAVAFIRKTPAPPPSAAHPNARPVIVLMDTPYPTHVYDPATQQSGGTNADDITDVLQDLPVTLVKENTSSLWRREAEILAQHPDLIVIHRSSFFTFPESQTDALYPVLDNKLVAFLGYISSQDPDCHFIVYSRRSWEDAAVAAEWRRQAAERFPSLAGKIETWRVPLDRATFRNPLTAQELKDSVVRQLHLPAPDTAGAP